MSAMPVSADDVAATAPVSQASSVQVVTNPDPASQPGQATDWSDLAKYQGYVPVQILGINDFHGGLSNTGTAQIGDQTYQNTGTAERLAGSLNQAESDFKAANPAGTTIRVEAGDMVGASPANSALLQDESTMHALKAMHIEYGTLGNHEFDEGLGEFNRIVIGGQPTKQYNDAEMAYPHEASDINIITANVILKGTKTDDNYGEIPYGFQPYIIKKIHTSDNKVVKIGFIGIETTDLPILTLYDNYKDYEILDEAETIAHYEKILRNQGVNAIVVLAHTGVETKNGETKGTAVDIIQKLYQIDSDNSVDIYLARHSHQYAMPRLVQSNWCRPSTPVRLMMTSLVISIRRLTTLRLTASSHMSSRSFQKKTIRLPSATRPLRESLRMLPSEWRRSSTKRLGRQQRQKSSPAACIIRQLEKTRLVSWQLMDSWPKPENWASMLTLQ